MHDYEAFMRLLIGGGAVSAAANGAMAWINGLCQRRIVRQQKLLGERQQLLESQRLDLDERAQTWSEMRDLIAAQSRQLQSSRFEIAQLIGKYEEMLRRHQTLEGECRQRHSESIARIEVLEQERDRWQAESAILRTRLETAGVISTEAQKSVPAQ